MIKQHILIELKQFIYNVSNHRGNAKNITSPPLIRSSLSLLEDLPAAREVVLEYFALIFDVSVNNYITYIGKDYNLPETPYEDEFINDIQDALENLVTKGPNAWSPLIASWSLELVGRLSDKYWPSKKVDINNACNIWLNCGAMKSLLGLIASSFRKMSNNEIELCINTLLAVFRKYSPTFDWVVARLGSCYPFKIISQVLHSGHKKFTEETRDNRCRFDSEIGILDYLSFTHEKDLKNAFKELLEDGFNPKNPTHIDIIPYIMYISTLSDQLLQPIVSVFLEMYNDTLLDNIIRKTSLWMQNNSFRDLQPSLNNVALKIKSNGAKLLLLCARLAEKFNWCQDFIEHILQELEQIILLKRTCSLIAHLTKEDSKRLLWKSAISSNFIEQQTSVRLLLLVSSQHHHIYHQTIAELLTKSYDINKNGIGALIRLFGGFSGVVEFPDIKPGIEMTLESIQLQKKFHFNETHPECLNAITNLIQLSEMEKNNASAHLKHQPITSILNECLSKILKILDSLLNKLQIEIETANPYKNYLNLNTDNSSKRIKIEKNELIEIDEESQSSSNNILINIKKYGKSADDSKELVHSIINLLNCIEAGLKSHNMGMTDVLKMAQLTVKYFFWSLTEISPTKRGQSIISAFTMFKRQCTARKGARSACCRDLVEGALFLYGNLFGACDDLYENDDNISDNERLITLNQKQGLAPNANRSVLHAGVIGKGLKITENGIESNAVNPDLELQSLLLKAIDCCCQDKEKANIVDGYSTVSLLLVEMVSPDVMYNGLPFPDEEFTKVTMERDLQIRRIFKSTPILWALLALVASHRPAICYSSVLLRALCASFLHQWRAKNVNKFERPSDHEELLCATRRVLEILSMGQLLPHPLSNLHMIINFLDATEISLILKECVWNYLKDNVPAPTIYQIDSNGLHWKTPSQVKLHPQYVDTLRNIMQKKLTKVGPHYYQMFVLPVLHGEETEKNENL